ncbi:MAG: hypothetical protein JXX28_06250 [Deltaproteobacteria bacterium]|nr:hypothetical protein [Deltaproteobacteria bacterium]
MPNLSLPLEASSDQVIAHLREHAVRVGNLWLPTPRDMRHWRESTAPFYLREARDGAMELGPRVPSLYAARFLPALAVRVRPHQGGALLEGPVRLPALTRGLLWAWAVVLLAWGASVLPAVAAGTLPPQWAVSWALLSLATAASGVLGRQLGGRLTAARLEQLRLALQDPPVPGEDW